MYKRKKNTFSIFDRSLGLFRCGNQNGDNCGNYDKMKLILFFAVATSWIEGCDHAAS